RLDWQVEHRVRRERTRDKPSGHRLAGRNRAHAGDLGNVDRREEAREEVDLPFRQHLAEQRPLARDVFLRVDGMDDESESVWLSHVGCCLLKLRGCQQAAYSHSSRYAASDSAWRG